MGARDILTALQAAGLQVLVVGDRLRVEPASRLTDALRSTIRQGKAELLAALTEISTISAGSPVEPPSAPRPIAPARRRFGLTAGELDEAHREPWSPADIARFITRVAAAQRRGFGEHDAEDLAERLHLLDVQAEGRVLCLGCRHLAGTSATGWRCGNHRAAGIPREVSAAVVTLPQRCPGFTPITEVSSC
jgi:hypothetical protein